MTKPKSSCAIDFFDNNQLNSHFANISSQHSPISYNLLSNLFSNLSTKPSYFNFSTIDDSLIKSSILHAIDSQNGISSDNLPVRYLAQSTHVITPVLIKIFNNVIKESTYPLTWKYTYITPLNKKTNPISLSDTRPISNIPHIARIFDNLLNLQITDYLNQNSCLSPFQSAHKKGFSTQTALLYITESIRKNLDNGNIVVLVQFDISKAFDSIKHDLLLSRLRNIGFSQNSTKLIWSYITNRSHSVLNQKGQPSPPIFTTSGIPQGSSLSGNLFNIYMDMLVDALYLCTDSYSIFADDTNIWLSCHPKQLKNCITLLNEECLRISKRLDYMGLKLNADKTTAIIFGSPHNLSTINISDFITINNTPIPFSNTIKILGVTLSDDLTWNYHISNISRNINFTLHRLHRMGSNLISKSNYCSLNLLFYLFLTIAASYTMIYLVT